MITPFTDDLRDVDIDAFDRLLEEQLISGIEAVVVAGTTGESPVLTHYEKKKLLRAAVDKCSGHIPVIAGTGSNNTEECVRNSNDAEKEGVDGLLIVTPFYNKCTQDGVLEHYFYIADRVSTPIIVYNVPSRTGFDIKPETYKQLSSHKMIKGVKEASSDITKYIRTKAICGERLDFYSGNDDLTAAMMAYGAKGVISVASNLIPDVMHRITSLLLSGDIVRGAGLQLKYEELIDSLFTKVNPVPVKAAMELCNKLNGKLRLPLTPLKENEKNELKRVLNEYKLI